MRKICVPSLAVLPICLAVSPSAKADFDLTFDNLVEYEAVYYTYDSSGSLAWDSAGRNMTSFAQAGMLSFNDGDIKGFCIELNEAVADGPELYEYQEFGFGPDDYQSPLGEDAVRLNERMAYVSGIFELFYLDAMATNFASAAFAMMTWELTHENFTEGDSSDWKNQVSLTSGALQFDEYSAQAAVFFNEMKAVLFRHDLESILALNNDALDPSTSGYQDFVVRNEIPAPSALVLAGIVGLGARRRRRRN